MIISPSILAADFLNLETEIKRFDSIKDLSFHIDIMDGHYVPNLTFGKAVIQNMHKITKHKLDTHLMVSNPEDYVDSLSNIGINNFTFHWEATNHHDSLISQLKENYKSVGISLNPATNANIIPLSILKRIDLILIMSVNPGFGGQSFIEYTYEKVKYFKDLKDQHGLNLEIQVDGGVTDKNASKLIQAGATNLVAGSYIFKEPNNDYKSKINSLR